MTDLRAHFDSLFAADDDPWNYRSSWPERRRLDLFMAMLPRETYDSVFEPACASGSLTARLAIRARGLVAWDGSANALAHAQQYLAASPHVEFGHYLVPDHWPEATFDLVVLSDFLYYLPEQNIINVATLAAQALGPHGSIVACHWRGSAHDFRVAGGDSVHALLRDVLGAPSASALDTRHVIEVWTP